jgi:hypothetical protein
MSISGILSSGFLQRQLGTHSTPYQQNIEQLSKDLQSGNLSAAQKDFSALQQDLDNLGGPASIHRFHHYHPLNTGNGDLTNSTQSSVLQPQPPVLIGGGPNPEPPILIGGGPFPEPAVSGPPVSTGGLRQPEPPISLFA